MQRAINSEIVNVNSALRYFYFFAIASKFVEAFAIFFDSRKYRWGLHKLAHKLFSHLFYQFRSDMISRVASIYFGFHIVGRGSSSQGDSTRIGFYSILYFSDFFGKFTGTNHQ